MDVLYYLLEANLYLAAFYGFYLLLLRRETFYNLNRYYLLATTVFAFVLPLIQLGYLYNLIGQQNYTDLLQHDGHEADVKSAFSVEQLIVYVYLAVAVLFLSRFLVNLYSIMLRVVKNPRLRKDKVVYVDLPGSEPAFSFFNFLFINPKSSDKHTIIRHELVHIHQKHSADIVFFEMVQALAWFSPVTYLLKKEIKLLHEYIADEVTTNTVQKYTYAMFLIQHSFGVVPNQLTNQIFNQSILKMRINMLNKEKSARWARLRFLLALPVVGGMLCASTMAFTKDYAMVDLYPEKYSLAKTTDQEPLKKAKSPVEKTISIKTMAPPPLPVPPTESDVAKKGDTKFPPPIVRPDKETKSKISKKRKEKIPPPIVKPDKQELPPPPPFDPNKANKITII